MPDKPQGVWVKFWCHHGPGHQGYDEKYEWYDASQLDEKGEPLHWQYDLEDWCDQWDNVSGKCYIVAELPPGILEAKIKRAKKRIKIEREWLKLLESMR